LSDNSQSRAIDLSRATELIQATISLLTEYRTDSHWDRLYDHAVCLAQLHSISILVPGRRRRPSHFNDSVVCETIGTGASSKEEYKINLYYPVLDQFLKELNTRFESRNIDVLKGISACTPNSSNFLSIKDLKSFCKMYGVRIEESVLNVEVELIKRLADRNSMDSLASI
uniref:Uncharacterized protein n=1 Tax=Amphimedon queenslandica TaxID=400682 RepID=A0A1X7VX50_AMPQE